MSNRAITSLSVAAFTAMTLAAVLPGDSVAQGSAHQARPTAQMKVVKPAKPPRPAALKTPSRPDKPRPGRQSGPDTPSQLANLVVIPFYNNPHGLPQGFPEHSYCVKKPTGGTPVQIKFWIRNAGGSDSGSFQWTPSFPTAGAAPAQVIANVPANGQLLITQGLPNGCYTPGFSGVCQFSISLDDHDEVEEWSEANTFESYCVSPAG